MGLFDKLLSSAMNKESTDFSNSEIDAQSTYIRDVHNENTGNISGALLSIIEPPINVLAFAKYKMSGDEDSFKTYLQNIGKSHEYNPATGMQEHSTLEEIAQAASETAIGMGSGSLAFRTIKKLTENELEKFAKKQINTELTKKLFTSDSKKDIVKETLIQDIYANNLATIDQLSSESTYLDKNSDIKSNPKETFTLENYGKTFIANTVATALLNLVGKAVKLPFSMLRDRQIIKEINNGKSIVLNSQLLGPYENGYENTKLFLIKLSEENKIPIVFKKEDGKYNLYDPNNEHEKGVIEIENKDNLQQILDKYDGGIIVNEKTGEITIDIPKYFKASGILEKNGQILLKKDDFNVYKIKKEDLFKKKIKNEPIFQTSDKQIELKKDENANNLIMWDKLGNPQYIDISEILKRNDFKNALEEGNKQKILNIINGIGKDLGIKFRINKVKLTDDIDSGVLGYIEQNGDTYTLMLNKKNPIIEETLSHELTHTQYAKPSEITDPLIDEATAYTDGIIMANDLNELNSVKEAFREEIEDQEKNPYPTDKIYKEYKDHNELRNKIKDSTFNLIKLKEDLLNKKIDKFDFNDALYKHLELLRKGRESDKIISKEIHSYKKNIRLMRNSLLEKDPEEWASDLITLKTKNKMKKYLEKLFEDKGVKLNKKIKEIIDDLVEDIDAIVNGEQFKNFDKDQKIDAIKDLLTNKYDKQTLSYEEKQNLSYVSGYKELIDELKRNKKINVKIDDNSIIELLKNELDATDEEIKSVINNLKNKRFNEKDGKETNLWDDLKKDGIFIDLEPVKLTSRNKPVENGLIKISLKKAQESGIDIRNAINYEEFVNTKKINPKYHYIVVKPTPRVSNSLVSYIRRLLRIHRKNVKAQNKIKRFEEKKESLKKVKLEERFKKIDLKEDVNVDMVKQMKANIIINTYNLMYKNGAKKALEKLEYLKDMYISKIDRDIKKLEKDLDSIVSSYDKKKLKELIKNNKKKVSSILKKISKINNANDAISLLKKVEKLEKIFNEVDIKDKALKNILMKIKSLLKFKIGILKVYYVAKSYVDKLRTKELDVSSRIDRVEDLDYLLNEYLDYKKSMNDTWETINELKNTDFASNTDLAYTQIDEYDMSKEDMIKDLQLQAQQYEFMMNATKKRIKEEFGLNDKQINQIIKKIEDEKDKFINDIKKSIDKDINDKTELNEAEKKVRLNAIKKWFYNINKKQKLDYKTRIEIANKFIEDMLEEFKSVITRKNKIADSINKLSEIDEKVISDILPVTKEDIKDAANLISTKLSISNTTLKGEDSIKIDVEITNIVDTFANIEKMKDAVYKIRLNPILLFEKVEESPIVITHEIAHAVSDDITIDMLKKIENIVTDELRKLDDDKKLYNKYKKILELEPHNSDERKAVIMGFYALNELLRKNNAIRDLYKDYKFSSDMRTLIEESLTDEEKEILFNFERQFDIMLNSSPELKLILQKRKLKNIEFLDDKLIFLSIVEDKNYYKTIVNAISEFGLLEPLTINRERQVIERITSLQKAADEKLMSSVTTTLEKTLEQLKKYAKTDEEFENINYFLGVMTSLGLHKLESLDAKPDKKIIDHIIYTILKQTKNEKKEIDTKGLKKLYAGLYAIVDNKYFDGEIANTRVLAREIMKFLKRNNIIVDDYAGTRRWIIEVLDKEVAIRKYEKFKKISSKPYISKVEKIFENKDLMRDIKTLQTIIEVQLENIGLYSNQFAYNPEFVFSKYDRKLLLLDNKPKNQFNMKLLKTIKIDGRNMYLYIADTPDMILGYQDSVIAAFNATRFESGVYEIRMNKNKIGYDKKRKKFYFVDRVKTKKGKTFTKKTYINDNVFRIKKDNNDWVIYYRVDPEELRRFKLFGEYKDFIDISFTKQFERNIYLIKKYQIYKETRLQQFQLGKKFNVLLSKPEYEELPIEEQNKYFKYYTMDFGAVYVNKKFEHHIKGTKGINIHNILRSFIDDRKTIYRIESLIIRPLIGMLRILRTSLITLNVASWINNYISSHMIGIIAVGHTDYLRNLRKVPKLFDEYKELQKELAIAYNEYIVDPNDLNYLKYKNKESELKNHILHDAFDNGIVTSIRSDAYEVGAYKENALFKTMRPFFKDKKAYELFKNYWALPDSKFGTFLGNYFDKTEIYPKLATYLAVIEQGGSKDLAVQKVLMHYPNYAINLHPALAILDTFTPYTKWMVNYPKMMYYALGNGGSTFRTLLFLMSYSLLLNSGYDDKKSKKDKWFYEHDFMKINDEMYYYIGSMYFFLPPNIIDRSIFGAIPDRFLIPYRINPITKTD